MMRRVAVRFDDIVFCSRAGLCRASDADGPLLKKAEAYFNGISTLQARFCVQVDPDGNS